MNPPLLEVVLRMQFPSSDAPEEQLNYFCRKVSDILPVVQSAEHPQIVSLHNLKRTAFLTFSSDHLELINKNGSSFPTLRPDWKPILEAAADCFQIRTISRLSLSYVNEIPIQDLRSFQDYLNFNIEMPLPLMERVEFFRTEFVYKYEFGEIRVWLQPDWDEQLESYAIQLSLESRRTGAMEAIRTPDYLQEMHEGIKDVFRQILSEDYIRQLPQ